MAYSFNPSFYSMTIISEVDDLIVVEERSTMSHSNFFSNSVSIWRTHI